jgi:hypothetical protein
MPKKFRLIFFYTFLLGFLISAPLVLLYTAGYRYHPGLGKIVKTGVVSVTSVPKNSTVFIDGDVQNQKTPATIDNVHATEHLIRTEKEGYLAWEKTLPVASNQTTFAEDIVLFLDQPSELLSTIDISELFISPSHLRSVYTLKEGAYRELWILEQSEETPTLLARVSAESSDNATISWSKEEHYLLLNTKEGTSNTYSIISTTKGEMFTLPNLSITNAWWDRRTETLLYYQAEDVTYTFDLTKELSETVSFKAEAITSADEGYYFINSTPERTSLSHYTINDLKVITHLPFGDYVFASAPSGMLLLHERSHDRLVLIDKNNSEPIILNTEASMWQWWGHYDLLFSDGHSLNQFNTGTKTTDTFLRLSETITDCAWHPFGTYIFYVQSDGIYAMELDDRDKTNTYHLADGQDVMGLWMDEEGISLQYFGQMNESSYGHHERLLDN